MKQLTKWQKDDIFLHYTGSMYGIGCSAFSKKAIQTICTYKKRSQAKGLILLIPHTDWLKRYGIEYEADISRLLQQFWPGNVTFLFQDSQATFSHLSVDETIAVRIPESKSLRDLLTAIDEPIISTSINLEGEAALTSRSEIEKKYADWFDYAMPQKDTVKAELLPSTIIQITEEELICLREGEIPFSMILSSYEQPKILFVCTANICRSPMAHYLMENTVQKRGWHYRTASAGFLNSGFPISKNSRLVLEENGIEGNRHVSTQLNEEIVQDSWLILTMTMAHKQSLLEMDVKAAAKTYSLLEFARTVSGRSLGSDDITDPFGMEIEEYRKTYQLIAAGLDGILPYLKNNAFKKRVFKK